MKVVEIVVWAISKDGEGKVIEMKRTDFSEEDEFSLPPLGRGWIYSICREFKEVSE